MSLTRWMLPALLVWVATTSSLQAAPAPELISDRPGAILLAALNENARAVRHLACKVDIDIKQNRSSVGLSGVLACGPDGRVRLRTAVLGQPAIDVGCGDKVAWWANYHARPLLCYKLSRRVPAPAGARWPSPFSPDWLTQVLGVAAWGRPHEYRLERDGNMLRLVQKATDPAGQPVRKVTLIRQTGTKVEVIGHRLEDAKGKLLGKVTVLAVSRERTTGAILPSKLYLEWPAGAVSVVMYLSDFRVNQSLDARVFDLPKGLN